MGSTLLTEVETDAEIDELSYDEVIDKKLGVMDLTAICLSRDHKIPIKVFNMTRPGALLENVWKAGRYLDKIVSLSRIGLKGAKG